MEDDELEGEGNVYVVMWDMYGLEGVIDASDMHRQDVFNHLMEERAGGLSSRINAMMLRARMNSQRSYEIYSINVTEDIGIDDIREWFEANPQGAADLIRSRGKRLLSQRNQSVKQVIA